LCGSLALWGCKEQPDDDAGDDDDTGDDDAADDDDTADDDDDNGDDDDDDADDDDDTGDDDTEVDTTLCEDAAAIHVDPAGTDDNSCGAEASPCATIGHGLDRVAAGSAVCAHAGQYDENWVALKDDTWLISVDGAQQAVIYSGTMSAVRFDGISNAGMDGFEVYGDWSQGDAGDGLIRVLDATDITIRNTVAHDAPWDQDVVKVSGQVSGLLLERMVVWNPGIRASGDCDPCFQENIDIFGSGAAQGDPPPVSDVIVRGCWLFHGDHGGDWLIYSKIYAENILYENNVFGPSAGGGWGNTAVGIGTSEAGIPDASAPVVDQAIVRNNIFVGLRGDGALTVSNADNTWIYNNTFYENSGGDLRSVIMFRGNYHDLGPIYLYDNLFVDNQPTQSGGDMFWVRDPLPAQWDHDYNLYFNNTADSDEPYTGEANGIYEIDPGLTSPAVPDTTNPSLARIAEIVAGFTIPSGSAAADAGVDVVDMAGHPNWHPGATDQRWDIHGDARPAGGSWDLGVDEVP